MHSPSCRPHSLSPAALLSFLVLSALSLPMLLGDFWLRFASLLCDGSS